MRSSGSGGRAGGGGDGGGGGGAAGGTLGRLEMGCRGPGCDGGGAGCEGGCVLPGAPTIHQGGAGCSPRTGDDAAVGHGRDGCGGDAGPCSPRKRPAAAVTAAGRAEPAGDREQWLQSGPPQRPPGSSSAFVDLSAGGGTRCSASSTAPPSGASALWG